MNNKMFFNTRWKNLKAFYFTQIEKHRKFIIKNIFYSSTVYFTCVFLIKEG